MRKTTITAVAIAAGTALWLGSGYLGAGDRVGDHPSIAERNAEVGRDDSAPNAVRARTMYAVAFPERIRVRGRTQNKRTVQVRAETVGRVVARPVERGDRVAAGDLLCRLAPEDREARVVQAQAATNQAQIEYRGSLRLQDRGFQSETAIAQAKARLAAAQAQLQAAVLDSERIYIRAPFSGVVEEANLEVGDYAQPGTPCASVVDLDPMLLVGHVSEADVQRLATGANATGRLATGETVAGAVSFIGHQADPETRTYQVEVTIANPDYRLRSGITTEFDIAIGALQAHKISSAVLALDDDGRLGVRTVDGDRVRFHLVDVVADDGDGVWVTGLPRVATLITVGQQFVVAGQQVSVQLEDAGEPQAAPVTEPDAVVASEDVIALSS